jgi:hypothetical protein
MPDEYFSVNTLLRTLWHHGGSWLAAGDKTSKMGRSLVAQNHDGRGKGWFPKYHVQ